MNDVPVDMRTREELLREIEELTARLRNEQEHTRAIRNGEVDALVISGPAGEQVYTLKEADRPYRIIVEEMKEGTVTLGGDGAILYCNKQFARMLKNPLSKLMGTSLYDYVDPFYHDTITSLLSRRETVTKRAEVFFNTSDFEQVFTYASFSPVVIDDTPVFLGLIADVTREIKLEQQIHLMQKMDALGRLAGGIAHDMNNILSPIILNTEALLEEGILDARANQPLVEILTAAYRQRELVKQILTFSRKGEQKLIPIKVIPLIEEALKLMRASLSSTIEIRLNLNTRSDTILGDGTQIHQVIMNLFSNAADAIGPQPGTITVSLDAASPDAVRSNPVLRPGKHLQLTVQDTGCGMTRDVVKQIFEPFFTTKDQSSGCGMGLSVVHGILKNHAGTIAVESELGKGSRFTIFLPLHEEKHRQPFAPAEHMSPAKGGEILLVDDEVIILSSMQRSLVQMGYHIEAASDVQEALRLFSCEPDRFDLVITDHAMPHMSGAQFAQEVIRLRPDMPIILYTGYREVISEEDAKARGIREVLIKPATTRDLNEAICRVLGHRDQERGPLRPVH